MSNSFTKKEIAVLVALSQNEEWCYPYRYIESQTGFSRDELKPVIKKLRQDGYVDYHRGLMDEEGMVAGSGFGVNYQKWREIRDVIDATPEKQRQIIYELLDSLMSYQHGSEYRNERKREVMKQVEKYVAVLMGNKSTIGED